MIQENIPAQAYKPVKVVLNSQNFIESVCPAFDNTYVLSILDKSDIVNNKKYIRHVNSNGKSLMDDIYLEDTNFSMLQDHELILVHNNSIKVYDLIQKRYTTEVALAAMKSDETLTVDTFNETNFICLRITGKKTLKLFYYNYK